MDDCCGCCSPRCLVAEGDGVGGGDRAIPIDGREMPMLYLLIDLLIVLLIQVLMMVEFFDTVHDVPELPLWLPTSDAVIVRAASHCHHCHHCHGLCPDFVLRRSFLDSSFDFLDFLDFCEFWNFLDFRLFFVRKSVVCVFLIQ